MNTFTPTPDHVAVTRAILSDIRAQYVRPMFATSLAAEDMVLTDLIAREQSPVQLFTLDTGKLHPETLAMIDLVQTRYGLTIRRMTPDAGALAAFERAHAFDEIYQSVDVRKACCNARKVLPLKAALADADAWLTGQRREQAVTRAELPQREFDAAHNIEKFNPLAHWTHAQVWDYIRAHDVPVNPLHAAGFPSIGCAPCTRPITPGEDLRAGRWWWESPEQKECGLHNNPRRPKNQTIIPVANIT